MKTNCSRFVVFEQHHPLIRHHFLVCPVDTHTHTYLCTLTQGKEGEDPLQHRGRLQSPVEGHVHGGKLNLHVFHEKRETNRGAAAVCEEEERVKWVQSLPFSPLHHHLLLTVLSQKLIIRFDLSIHIYLTRLLTLQIRSC